MLPMVYKLVKRTVNEYNRFRGAEARARLLRVLGNTALVEFSGSFCYTCGFRDWLEDLTYTAMLLGLRARLIDYIELDDGLGGLKAISLFVFEK